MYVRRLTTLYGENAGKIWSALNQEGCSNKENILQITKLDEDNFYSGIGWLARENKIATEDEDCFRLGNTNIDSQIGNHAGMIWKILDIWGEVDIHSIKRLADIQEEDAQTALGWLAKEDKICVDKYSRFSLKGI